MAGDEQALACLPYLMTSKDVLFGFLCAPAPAQVPQLVPCRLPPRQALEVSLAEALAAPPCLVTFSGGRDSSALLATAVLVARREGLDLPVAFTLRHIGAADATEQRWQEMVIRHVGPVEWQVVELRPEESDLVGPVATASLSAHGLLWPPMLHAATAWLGRAQGATVVTGEGGDEIFGPRRATAMSMVVRFGWRDGTTPLSHLLGRAARGTAPDLVRERLALRAMARDGTYAWLRPHARAEALQWAASLREDQPYPWEAAVRRHLSWPALTVGIANMGWLGAQYGARYVHPYLDARFVDAMARAGGFLGYPGRTEAMRRLFGDLLPDAVLARSTKATFNTVYHSQATRQFALAWDGTGVDSTAVDPEALRSAWLAARVDVRTTALLQTAWLASSPTRPAPLTGARL